MTTEEISASQYPYKYPFNWGQLVGLLSFLTLDYFMPNPVYTYKIDTYDLYLVFGLFLWHISHCRSFNVGHLMPNPFLIHIEYD